ncbi:MAG: hypothetical protein ACPLW8_04300 [Candidatus Bathyarchaeales archaeon]
MDTKKLFATFAILIIALGIVGFTYAHWSKIVTVDGTVNTGKLNLIIVSAADDDNGIDPDYDKNVADTVITRDQNDPQIAHITITNAYPSYHVYWHVTIRNVGTIPAKLYAFEIEKPDCLTVQAWDGLGEQIDPYSWGGTPDKYQKDYSGYVHVLQCAEQGATYTFTVKFVFWNWNEVP